MLKLTMMMMMMMMLLWDAHALGGGTDLNGGLAVEDGEVGKFDEGDEGADSAGDGLADLGGGHGVEVIPLVDQFQQRVVVVLAREHVPRELVANLLLQLLLLGGGLLPVLLTRYRKRLKNHERGHRDRQNSNRPERHLSHRGNGLLLQAARVLRQRQRHRKRRRQQREVHRRRHRDVQQLPLNNERLSWSRARERARESQREETISVNLVIPRGSFEEKK